jgi:aminoglycoside phosphotransferase (APT) family kinase protein
MAEEITDWLAALGWQVTAVLGDRPVYQVTLDGRLAIAKTSDPREPSAIARLGAAGLPVQQVLRFDDPFLLMEWTDGDQLTSLSPLPAQEEAGRLLRIAHALGSGPPYKGNETFAEWMRGWLTHNLQWWQPGPSREALIWEWFASLTGLLRTRGNDLMLMDGRPDHFLVRGGRIAGVIDVGEICPGDGVMDLAVMGVSDPALLKGVLAGYGAHEARLVPLYLLIRRLSRAEWLIAHGRPLEAGQILRLVQADPPFAGLS